MIGDSYEADVSGARSAGLEAVLVRNTHPSCPEALPNLETVAAWLQE